MLCLSKDCHKNKQPLHILSNIKAQWLVKKRKTTQLLCSSRLSPFGQVVETINKAGNYNLTKGTKMRKQLPQSLLLYSMLDLQYILMNNAQQLKHNIQQQTKRLLDQLKQLEENKADLTEEEYNQLKQSTIQELQTFQNSLNNMLADPKNSLLQSEIQKTKRSIFEAFKSQFNKEEIVDKLLSEQAKGTRNRIKDLQHKYHMKTINQPQYISKKRKMIVQIEQMGAKLTTQQQQWLNLHHHFADKGTQQVKEEIQKNQMKIVQKKIQEKQ